MTMVPVMAPMLIARVSPIFSRVSSSKFRIMNQGNSASKTSMTPPYTTTSQHTGFLKPTTGFVPIVAPPRYWR